VSGRIGKEENFADDQANEKDSTQKFKPAQIVRRPE